MDVVNDLRMEPPAITSLGCSLTSAEEVNSSQKQKRARKEKRQGKAVEHNNKGSDFSLNNSLQKTDDTIKDPLHESSSQRIVEFNSEKKYKRRKRKKTEHNATESNANCCDAPEDTFSSKTSTPALDMLSEHPIEDVSIDSGMRQSCIEMDSCQGENEEKQQNIAENSNRVYDVQESSCSGNSVVSNAKFFAEESVLEAVKLNIEQGINYNSCNPAEKSGFVKNVSMEKKHDDYPAVYRFSNKFPNVKTYTRRKIVNSNNERNNSFTSPENCNEEPIMLDHHEDDSHKFSDGPLMVGLLEREKKLSRDEVTSHSGAAAKEMKLMTEGISEQRFMTTSSVVDTPLVRHEETNDKLLDQTEITRNDPCCAGDVSDISLVNEKDVHSKISQFSLDKTNSYNTKKKLLILDVNGLLADFVSYVPRGYREPDFSLTRRNVYKRPFCDDFLKFCFDRFHVGVWSSRAKSNVDKVVEFLMGKSASKLLFSWSHCTMTEFSTVENRNKPLVLKELRKLWEKVEPGLPWEKGEFNESNTLLLDDSPYKALVNPMYTAIFPYSYHYYDSTDSSLGPGGDLRVYLEGLAMAENVQEYVSSNPFGQRPIRETNPSWRYYRKVIEAVKCEQSGRSTSPGRKQTAYQRMQDEGSPGGERTAYRRMQNEGSPGGERTAYRRMQNEGS
ncbi:uncharacterized protein LOC133286068 isoform X2 [Gastrolobium bilobum]|uniref:uncharacterized protein LOC133286068 isoform X2 n=1 Tax=Gastrolobium bilobum TaxID=150636 RepID=UPI002AB0A43B|nr:uncharacterized protein LOC133286068 isoform X2 [Gastrolobium bilobum]